MITLKLESSFLREIDGIVRASSYQNRTEFIRNALREKVDETKLKKAMLELVHLKGASPKKTSKKEYELVRQHAAEELFSRLQNSTKRIK